MNETSIDRPDSPVTLTRRQLLGVGVAGVGLGLNLPRVADAASVFPDHLIRIIVPYSAGTGSDLLARTVAQGMTTRSHASVITENRDGGGSLIGTLEVAKSSPDGYTILMAANPTAIVPTQYRSPPYDPTKDFTPIVKVAVIPLVLAASPNLPVSNLKELIAYAKANPGKLNYGSSGPGTISQQQMELFKQAAGINVQEIPYRSTAQAMTDLIGGTISLFPVVVSSVSPHLKSGRVKGLAVFDVVRSSVLPDVPAVSEEVKVAGYVPVPVWYGFVAPANTPSDAITALAGMIETAMDTPDAKSRLETLGARRISVGREQFAIDIKNEFEKSTTLSKRLGTLK
jgi:tripartite-type tricarboxylate transporter receptor subunit TctC